MNTTTDTADLIGATIYVELTDLPPMPATVRRDDDGRLVLTVPPELRLAHKDACVSTYKRSLRMLMGMTQ